MESFFLLLGLTIRGRHDKKKISAIFFFFNINCAIKFYPGPIRPDHEISILESYSTVLISIDDVKLTTVGTAKRIYKILPGIHKINLKLDFDNGFVNIRSNSPKTITFYATAGKIYQINPHIIYSNWYPTIHEKGTNKLPSQRLESWD